MNLNLLKLGGITLIISSVCSMAGNILHPRLDGWMEPHARDAAVLVSSNQDAWLVIHGILLTMVPLLMLGFVITYTYLLRQGEKIFSTLGVTAIAMFSLLSVLVFILDGFTGPFLAHEYEKATALTKAADLQIFHFNYTFGLIVTAVSFVALVIDI